MGCTITKVGENGKGEEKGKKEKRSNSFIARLLIAHSLYFLYSSILWFDLWRVAGRRHFENHATFAALITWFCIYIALNIYLMVAALCDKM